MRTVVFYSNLCGLYQINTKNNIGGRKVKKIGHFVDKSRHFWKAVKNSLIQGKCIDKLFKSEFLLRKVCTVTQQIFYTKCQPLCDNSTICYVKFKNNKILHNIRYAHNILNRCVIWSAC